MVFNGLLGFWERIFAVGFHISSRRWSVTARQRKGMAVFTLSPRSSRCVNYQVDLIAMHRLTNIQDEYNGSLCSMHPAVVIWLLSVKRGSTGKSTGRRHC